MPSKVMQNKNIRILIADNQTLFRKGLIALFEKEPGIYIVGEASDGAEALNKSFSEVPDVLIVNILMPVLDGITISKRLKEQNSKTEVLFLASSYQEENVRNSFEAGGRGYLLKSCEYTELLYAVKKAAHGDYYISGEIGPDMVASYINNHLKNRKHGGLMTAREKELARLLADGYSTKESAEFLNISPKTAETHRASIMKKLKAKNVTDIVKYCIRNHIIEA